MSFSVEQLIEDFPKQLKRGIIMSADIRFPKPAGEIRNVVIAGMGGSGIGANHVASFVFDDMKVPLTILKNYELPAFVNAHTLFIASSFSGNTEETLIAFEQAVERKAIIACITSGGKLKERALELNLTLSELPNEAPSPRAFLGYSFTQLLYVLELYGVISNFFETQLQEAIWLLEQEQKNIRKDAEKLAKQLAGKLTVIYADDRFYAPVVRLQQQLNENSKQLAHVNVFPEMNHNELVGYLEPKSIWKDTVVLLIRTDFDHPRVKKRMDVCKPIFKETAGQLIEIKTQGDYVLEQSVYLIHLFDWISWYVAQENQVDAFEIKNIDYLKEALTKE
jgi:glucose/mannose-6-phosphate isomerase